MRRHLTLNLSLALAFLVLVWLAQTAAAAPPTGLNTGAGPWQWINPAVQGSTISAVSFVSAGTGWGVGLDGTILKTTDSGATWSAQNSGTVANLTGVKFVDANNGWAVGADGITGVGIILHTADGGATWSAQTAPTTAALEGVHFFDTQSGIAVGNGVAFYTTNGGATWSAGTGVDGGDYLASVQMLDAANAWAVGSQGAIYRTTTHGVSWNKLSPSPSAGTDLRALYMIDANTGFAVSSKPGGGKLFRFADPDETGPSPPAWAASTSNLSTALWGVTVTNGNLLAVGDDGKILKYVSLHFDTDSLDTIAAGLANVSSGTTSRLMAITAATTSTVYASGDGGAITRSDTSGESGSWNLTAGGDAYNMMGASFITADEGWVAGENGAVFHTTDGGASWTADASGIPADMNIQSLQFINGTTGFAAGCQGTGSPCVGTGVAYKYNSGAWSAMTVPGGITTLNSIHMSDATHGWAVGAGGVTIRTSDATTWAAAGTGIPATVVLNGVDTTDAASNGWTVGCQLTGIPEACTEGELYQYAGGSWSKATLSAPPTFMNSVDMVNATTGYAVGNSGKAYKTSDGTTWSVMTTGTGKLLASVSFAPGNPDIGFAAGEYGRIIHTIDGGVTWSAEDLGTNISMFAVSTLSEREAYVAGGNSAVLKSLRPYYFTWYDDVYAANWVLTANPKDAPGDLWFNLFIGGVKRDMTSLTGGACGAGCEPGQIPAGRSQAMRYTGLLGGPVNAASMTSAKGIVSQRIIWPAGGSSMEEVLGTDIEKLSDHFYWTWYDQAGAGYSNWVLVSNPNPYPVYYTIKKGGVSTDASATAVAGIGKVTSISLTNGGSGYTSTPTVNFTGGGGSGATAVAFIGGVTGISVTNGGSGYTSAPIVEILGGGGSGASASAILTNGVVTGMTVTGKGAGYTSTPTVRITKNIPPGGNATPQFPGAIGGPIEVQAYTTSGMTAPANVMASQRVLSNGGSAFNEVPGIPKRELRSDYLWTWYDASPGARDWILVANPAGDAATSIWYKVFIDDTVTPRSDGTVQPGVACKGPIADNFINTPEFPVYGEGPVEVKTYSENSCTVPADSIASQRITWSNGLSFEEVPGYARTALNSDYHWTWYDQSSPGMTNWVLVANPDSVNPVYYEITLGSELLQSGNIEHGQNVTPTFSTKIGGPIEVRAWISSGKAAPANVMTSQRVLYNGYFNEVLGMVLN